MGRLRIAVLLTGKEQFSPYYGGAVARWTYEVYSRLPASLEATIFGVRAGKPYDYPFVTSRADWLPDLCSKVPYLRRYEDQVYLAQLMPQLRHYDVVHIQNRAHWAIFLRQLGYKGKIVAHLHNSHLAHYDVKRLDELATRLDCLVSCSRYIAGTFRGRSSTLAKRCVVVYNGVNRDIFQVSKRERAKKQVLFVGRIHPEKGVLPLMNAFSAVADSHPDSQLVIGGATGFGVDTENDYVRELREVAARLNSRGKTVVLFPGYIDHDAELPRYFQEATCAVFPSVSEEPFGMVVCEAMACGAPVIATRRGGIPEAAGDAALLLDSPEPLLLAEAIVRLIDDANLQVTLSRASISQAAKYDWKVIAAKWAGLLVDVAAGNPMNNVDDDLDSGGHVIASAS